MDDVRFTFPVTNTRRCLDPQRREIGRENLPKFQAALPDGMKVGYDFSTNRLTLHEPFSALTMEGLWAASTGLMVLLFLA